MLLLICIGHAAMLVFVAVDELPHLHIPDEPGMRRSSDLVRTTNEGSHYVPSPTRHVVVPNRAVVILDSRRELV